MVRQIAAGRAVLYPGARETMRTLAEQGFRLVFLEQPARKHIWSTSRLLWLDAYFDAFYCCETYCFIPKG